MKPKVHYFIAVIVLMLGVNLAMAAVTQELRGGHKKNELTCASCHGVETPDKAATQDACIDCHGDMHDTNWITFEEKGHKYEHSPHESHESPIDCTKCHGIHKPSTLFCNTCHGFTNIVVP